MEKADMKKLSATFLVAAAMTFASAGSAWASDADLLSEFTASGSSVEMPLASADLESIRGEGTFEKVLEIPQFPRSFEKVFNFDETTISIIGVEGVGLTITVDSPRIP
jgi:hypothetical protein